MPLDTTVSNWTHDKTEARASGGMVSSRHPESAKAGRSILQQGGNAVDAAVAASFAESVVQPAASTIGGGGIFTFRGADGDAHGINYMWQTPLAAKADMFPIEGKPERGLFGWSGVKNAANEIGALAVAVPGSVAGLVEASKRFGRLPLKKVLEPAIALAADGYEMDWYGSLMAGIHLDIIKEYPTTARMLLRDGQYPYRPNMIGRADRHKQPALAETLSAIADRGAEAFYTGKVAESIVAAVQEKGGIVSLEDLATYKPFVSKQRSVSYRGHKISGEYSGFVIYGQVFNTLSHFDVGAHAPDSPERLRILIDVLRRCWADKGKVYQDFDSEKGPWDVLLSSAYASQTAQELADSRPKSNFKASSAGESRTVHISAIDAEGGMASLTETVIGNYGSFICSETGVLLNNGMISFAPIPGEVTSIRPGRRSASSFISPLHITRPDGKSIVTVGSSGGSKIVTSKLQIASLIMDHGMSPQQAVSFPRFDFEGDKLILDPRFPQATIDRLKSLGYDIELRLEELSTFEYGNPAVLARDADGVITGGVNPFQATTAVGFNAA